MEVTEETRPRTRTRRSNLARETTPAPAPKRRLTIMLNAKAYQYLGAHALALDLDLSEIVESLIVANLKRYRLRDTGKEGSNDTVEGSDDGERSSDSTLPIGETIHPFSSSQVETQTGEGERLNPSALPARTKRGRSGMPMVV